MTSKPTARKPISKNAFLEVFSRKVQPNSRLDELLKSFPGLFSLETVKPENLLQTQLGSPEEMFIQKTTDIRQQKPQNTQYQKKYVTKSPFSGSGLGDQWWYLDETNKTQGPFTTSQMDGWYDQGYFKDFLKIKASEKGEFEKLHDLLGKTEGTNPYQKQGMFGRKDYGQGQTGAQQFQKRNDNGWERGKPQARNQEGEKAEQNTFSRNARAQESSEQQKGFARNTKEVKEESPVQPSSTVVDKVEEKVQPEKKEEKPVEVPVKVEEAVKQEEPQVEKPVEAVAEQVESKQEDKVEEEETKEEVEEVKQPEATQKEDDFGGEWKVNKSTKGKKGKRGKFAPIQLNDPTAPKIEVDLKPAQQVKEESKQAVSPTKAKPVQAEAVVREAPVIEAGDFPTLSIPVQETKVVEKPKPKKKEVKHEESEVKKPVVSQDDFPSLAAPKKTVETEVKKQQPKKQEKVQQPEPVKQKKEVPVADDESSFPSLGNLKSEAPVSSQQQPKAKKGKGQFMPMKIQPTPKTNAWGEDAGAKEAPPKSQQNSNPSYSAHFPSL